MALLTLIVGLSLLVLGADLVVRGASRFAGRLRISPVIVGLTVVALATSLPEAVVSLGGVWQGRAELALGNAVGSNLFNILFILGAVALLRPLAVNRCFLRRELPALALVTLCCLFAAIDGTFSRGEGLLLVVGLTGYLALVVRSVGRQATETPLARKPDSWDTSTRTLVLLLGGGVASLGLGAHIALGAAVDIAASFSVGERVVGLFVLGAGSSLPELVTSVVAVRRGSSDIAIGNVLGSCLFNLLFVLGLTSVLAPSSVAFSSESLVDVAAMAAAFAVAAVFLRSGLRLSRLEGGVLVLNYLGYLGVAVVFGERSFG